MTNKSEELCKLLEIELKEKDEINCLNCPYNDGELDEADVCPHFAADECEGIEYIYPDLTKPSNFVKMLKLKYGRGSYVFDDCQYKIDVIYVENLEEEIINNLISKIKIELDNPCQIFEDLEGFKQQAQQIEWEY